MRRTTFTIIEMLVVVTVFVVLGALLIPILDQASNNAQRTHCMGVQKDLHLAAISFTDDHDDWLPHAHNADADPRTPVLSHSWLATAGDWDTVSPGADWYGLGAQLADYMEPRTSGPVNLTVYGAGPQGNVAPYGFPVVLPRRIAICPSVTGANRQYWPSLGMNRTITSNDDHHRRRLKLAEIIGPDRLLLFGDRFAASDEGHMGGMGWYGFFGDLSPWTQFHARRIPRHGKRDNFVFVDGHGEDRPFRDELGLDLQRPWSAAAETWWPEPRQN